MVRHWVITRERDDAVALVDALAARGLRAQALPCISRTTLPWPAELTPSTSARTVIMCTSAFAAQRVVERWPALVLEAAGAPLEVAAVAPVTSGLLEEAGIRPQVVVEGGSVALAEAVCAHVSSTGAKARILYPSSDAGTEAVEQARAVEKLAEVGVVVRGVVYKTEAAPSLPRRLVDEFPTEEPGVVFFSPSAVEAFCDACGPLSLVDVRAVCVGESTARAWNTRKPLGAPRAISVPRGASLVDTLVSLM